MLCFQNSLSKVKNTLYFYLRRSLQMGYTIEQYEALKRAIVNGVQSVSYGDKTVNYRSIVDMKEALRLMEQELFPERVGRRRRLACVDRGYFSKTK